MALKDTLARLFGRGSVKPPELPRQAVEFDSIDRMVYDDHKADSARFRRMVLDKPPVIVPNATEPSAPDFTTATPEEVKQWQQDVRDYRAAREKADPYVNWEELTRDLFYAYHHTRPPQVLDPSELAPDVMDHAKIMSAWMAQDAYGEARNETRDNGMMSGMAVMAGVQHLREQAEDILTERMRQAQEINEAMRDALERMDELQSLREMAREHIANGEPVSPNLRGRIKDAVNAKRQAQQSAARMAENAPSPMTEALYEAIVQAAGVAQQAAQNAGNVPSFGQGFGAGEPVYESPEQALAIAEAWSKGELAEIAAFYGRMFRDFHFKRAKRVVGGQDEIVDIETGDELRRITPAELSLLADDDTEDDFYSRYSSKELLVYSTVGEEHAGRGPIILVVDGSGSMSGERNVWARALALTLLNVCRREKRDFAFIEFSSAGQLFESMFPSNRALDPQQILDMASHFFGGGTTPIIGIARGVEILQDAPRFRKADLVLVSDGQAGFGPEDKRMHDWMAEHGVRCHGIGIGGTYGYLKQMCDTDTLVTIYDMDLADANAATDQLAVSIT